MRVLLNHIVFKVSILLFTLVFNSVMFASSDIGSNHSLFNGVPQPQKSIKSSGSTKDQSCESSTFMDDWIKSVLFDSPMEGEGEGEEEEELEEEHARVNSVYLQRLFFIQLFCCNSIDSLSDHTDSNFQEHPDHIYIQEESVPRYISIQVFRL